MKESTHGATDLSVASALKPSFQAMGFNKTKYYFYARATNQVIALKLGQIKVPWLFSLADLHWWQQAYPTQDKRCHDKVNWTQISSDLIRQCHEIGEFKGIRPAPAKRLA
ncbi:hypothetical protein [uncultured Shewanella sp.]|uniref:hypothetical protein n=1 Tax=uncultured Shewanella sp. TaxID=173975 RepID=UPI002618FC40|nr:hypothetical protein [uncultured Shewanella sp.]